MTIMRGENGSSSGDNDDMKGDIATGEGGNVLLDTVTSLLFPTNSALSWDDEFWGDLISLDFCHMACTGLRRNDDVGKTNVDEKEQAAKKLKKQEKLQRKLRKYLPQPPTPHVVSPAASTIAASTVSFGCSYPYEDDRDDDDDEDDYFDRLVEKSSSGQAVLLSSLVDTPVTQNTAATTNTTNTTTFVHTGLDDLDDVNGLFATEFTEKLNMMDVGDSGSIDDVFRTSDVVESGNRKKIKTQHHVGIGPSSSSYSVYNNEEQRIVRMTKGNYSDDDCSVATFSDESTNSTSSITSAGGSTSKNRTQYHQDHHILLSSLTRKLYHYDRAPRRELLWKLSSSRVENSKMIFGAGTA